MNVPRCKNCQVIFTVLETDIHLCISRTVAVPGVGGSLRELHILGQSPLVLLEKNIVES